MRRRSPRSVRAAPLHALAPGAPYQPLTLPAAPEAGRDPHHRRCSAHGPFQPGGCTRHPYTSLALSTRAPRRFVPHLRDPHRLGSLIFRLPPFTRPRPLPSAIVDSRHAHRCVRLRSRQCATSPRPPPSSSCYPLVALCSASPCSCSFSPSAYCSSYSLHRVRSHNAAMRPVKPTSSPTPSMAHSACSGDGGRHSVARHATGASQSGALRIPGNPAALPNSCTQGP